MAIKKVAEEIKKQRFKSSPPQGRVDVEILTEVIGLRLAIENLVIPFLRGQNAVTIWKDNKRGAEVEEVSVTSALSMILEMKRVLAKNAVGKIGLA